MPRKSLILSAVTLIVIFGFATTAPSFAASKGKVLYNFNCCTDGVSPSGGLIFDAAGNLYGTTVYGGANDGGVVFKLSPGGDRTRTETVLHSFSGPDGLRPDAHLIFDANANLYGTTTSGGAYGGGTAFQLTPNENGTWTEAVLYSFCSATRCTNPRGPNAGLIFDAAGNLYGTTTWGGTYDSGTVFELSPGQNGEWNEKVLHSFNGNDGRYPYANLIFDTAGNLYGTTAFGGSSGCYIGCGTVFELTPGAKGKWKEKVLHRFSVNGTDGKDGWNPYAGVISDTAGNLYGTTEYGGFYYYGTVFQLAPKANGEWTERLLRSFYFERYPGAGLVFDARGNLYGETPFGGDGSACMSERCGTVFQFAPSAGGKWTYRVLFSFDAENGAEPSGGLILDPAGNLYGTTFLDGAYGYGVVFEVTP